MTGAVSTPDRVWTILELLRWTTGHFTSRGIETARLDAECLLAHVLDIDRLRLYVDFDASVGERDRTQFRELVKRRADERVPVALLVGRKEFWSMSFRVTPDVLIPRPDTETLVSAALELLPEAVADAQVLDIGTGSGVVAVAIAVERPTAHLVGTDISQAALEIARENADEHGVGDRCSWQLGSLFEPVSGRQFDLIVSNPPYVAEKLQSELAPELAHEPSRALFAGEEGMDVLTALIEDVGERLVPGGGLAFELAPEQADRVASDFRRIGLTDVRVHRDLGHRPRVVSGRRPETPPADSAAGKDL
jgi:release factor glutamine methyltransferase